jgi:hypothetical protein
MPVGHNISTVQQVFWWVGLLADVGLATYLVTGFVRRERAGRILFDLGRISEKPQQIGIGVAFILLGFFEFRVNRDFRWTLHIFYILQGVNLIVIGMQRFLICEAGILSTGRRDEMKLYQWDDILGYEVGKGKLRLQLRDKSPIGERWITCRPGVYLDEQEALDAVLATRCARLKLPVGV